MFYAVVKSKGGLEYFEYYKIELHHLFKRVELLKIDETISNSVHVRRPLTENSCDFILDIMCDGVTEDSIRDINYRKVALKYLRGSINPQSSLYLDVLMNPAHHVPHRGKPRDGSATGTVLSISNVPDAAALAAAAATAAAATAAAAVEHDRAAAAEQARFDQLVHEKVAREVQKTQREFLALQERQYAHHQQIAMSLAAQSMSPQMFHQFTQSHGSFNPMGHGQVHAGSGVGGAAASVQSQGAAGVLSIPQNGGWPSWDQSQNE